MSITGVLEKDRRWQRQHSGKQRRHVLYLADKVTLAVYHKRPAHEIAELMASLKAATRKDN